MNSDSYQSPEQNFVAFKSIHQTEILMIHFNVLNVVVCSIMIIISPTKKIHTTGLWSLPFFQLSAELKLTKNTNSNKLITHIAVVHKTYVFTSVSFILSL